jgi:2-C-methyl-D-erythritol 4-phosphate cytidylyltransferase
MELPSQQTKITDPFWIVVPAAGVGKRMASDIPKQYLQIAGVTILEHTLRKLLSFECCKGLIVAVSQADCYWHDLEIASHEKISCVAGGMERSDSVLNALQYIADKVSDNDWVLVHDAARPCITIALIEKLLLSLESHPVGGLLAIPVADTVKRLDAQGLVTETLDRSELWLAQTPQMFRYSLLRKSLSAALAAGVAITDEASALEWCGYKPLVVAGSSRNFKITRAEDLALAEFFLQQESN